MTTTLREALEAVFNFQISEILERHGGRRAGVCKEWVELKKLVRAALNAGEGPEPSPLAALTEARTEIERLKSLVYVPGLWRCAKCNFSLVQANLNAKDGTVTARDKPGDKCPNCDSPLWRVTERDAGNEMVDRAEELLKRATDAEALLTEAVKALVRITDVLECICEPSKVDMRVSATNVWADAIAACRGARITLSKIKAEAK